MPGLADPEALLARAVSEVVAELPHGLVGDLGGAGADPAAAGEGLPGALDPVDVLPALLEPFHLPSAARIGLTGRASDAFMRRLRERAAHVEALGRPSLPGTTGAAQACDVTLVCGHALGPCSPDAVSALADDLELAAAALSDDGVMLVALDHRASQIDRLVVPRHAPSLGADAELTLDDLRGMLVGSGLDEQEVLLALHDGAAPMIMLSAAVAGHADTTMLVTALARGPLGNGSPGAVVAVDPQQAFVEAWQTGSGASTMRSVVVAAARAREPLEGLLDEGRIWSIPAPERAGEWLAPREVVRDGTSWLIQGRSAEASRRSGPLALVRSSSRLDLELGENGETVLCEAIAADGLRSARVGELLRAWWRSALTAYVASPTDARRFDLQPKHFVVSSTGEWHLIAQDLSYRFPIPHAALALRSLAPLLMERLLRWRWIPDVTAEETVMDVLAELLAAIDLEADDAAVYLWISLEADILLRTGASSGERKELMSRLQQRAESSLRGVPPNLPLPQRVRAAISLAGAPSLAGPELPMAAGP